VFILNLLFRGISLLLLIGFVDWDCAIEAVCLDAPVTVRRERLYLQILNGSYASTGRRIYPARLPQTNANRRAPTACSARYARDKRAEAIARM
jgi:hypothetical protein